MTQGDTSYEAGNMNTIPPVRGIYENGTGAGETDNSGASAGDQVKQTASQVVDTAQHAVSKATESARQQAASQIATRKGQAAEGLDGVSQAVGHVGDQLRQDDHETLAQYADMAAQQVGRVATYVRERNVGEMLDEVQRLARRQPVLFLAGAFALGVLGARFLKSSAPQSGSGTSSRGTSPDAYAPYGHQSNGYGATRTSANVREVPRER